MESFLGQLLPNLVATFAGVLLALYVDGYLERRRSRALEAGLLQACLTAVEQVTLQREDVITFLNSPTRSLVPDFRLGLLEGVVPRLAEVTTDTDLVSLLDSLRQRLLALDRGLSRCLDSSAASGQPLADRDLQPLRHQFQEAMDEASARVCPALYRRLDHLVPSRRREREKFQRRLRAAG